MFHAGNLDMSSRKIFCQQQYQDKLHRVSGLYGKGAEVEPRLCAFKDATDEEQKEQQGSKK